MKVEITMEITKRIAIEREVNDEQLKQLKNGENPFGEEMEYEIESGCGSSEYDYSVNDEYGNTIVEWS